MRLKVLGSPKLPSPALYFRPGDGPRTKPLEPQDLPQGRKVYLHHSTDANAPEPQPWRTKLPRGHPEEEKQRKLKNAVRPVRPETAFIFHLDFDNLSEREINLLAFSLRPSEDFRHKLGMGKSIGLGTVRIDPLALLLIDRVKRYSQEDPFSSTRWHHISVDEVHDLMTGTGRQQRVMLNVIRHVTNELCIPLVRTALIVDPQMARRFQFHQIPSWAPGEAFNGLVGSVLRAFPLRRPSILTARSLKRLVNHGKGNTSSIFNILIELGARAVMSGEERVTAEDIMDYIEMKNSPAHDSATQ
jgi:hypothetical protein